MKIKTKIVSSHTADSKPVKQEVNCTVILPHLVFPGEAEPLSVVYISELSARNVPVSGNNPVEIESSKTRSLSVNWPFVIGPADLLVNSSRFGCFSVSSINTRS